MTQTDWLLIMCIVLGWVSGLYLGWILWRRPQLKYRGVEE